MTSARLAEVCDISSGGTPRRGKPGYFGGRIPWVKIGDIEAAGGNPIVSTQEYITQAGLDAIGNRLFPAGSVLLAMYGSVGKVGVAGRSLATNQAILGIRVSKPDRVDPLYLRRWLQAMQPSLMRMASGVTQQNISATIVRNLTIPLPPLAEQRRIAAMHEEVDSLLRWSELRLMLVRELKRSAFVQMFGDARLNSRHWQTMTLGSLVESGTDIVDGPFGSALKPDSYVTTGIPVIRNANIVDGKFDGTAFKFVTHDKFESIRRSEVRAGDVLISTKGTIGNSCVAPELGSPAVLSATGTVRVRLATAGRVRSDFLSFLFNTQAFHAVFASKQAGTNQQYLTLSTIRDLSIILPPLDLQLEFSSVCESADRELQPCAELLRKLRALKASVVHLDPI